MGKLEKIAKYVPILPALYRALRKRYLQSLDTEEVFTKIYKGNRWGGERSVSGTGSDEDQTRMIPKELSTMIDEFGISTMLDIPCGDFYWMKNVDLSKIDYTGADIVKELVDKNSEEYGGGSIRFQHMDLVKDKLPNVDLIFCRDCLVHFSFTDIFLALENVCNSQSEYLLTTTFTDRRENDDIATGQWRTLNLEVSPFGLPSPLGIILEKCTEGDGVYKDKALGLWRISDIRKSLEERPRLSA